MIREVREETTMNLSRSNFCEEFSIPLTFKQVLLPATFNAQNILPGCAEKTITLHLPLDCHPTVKHSILDVRFELLYEADKKFYNWGGAMR